MHSNAINNLALGLFASIVVPASAFWRMPCPGVLVTERADPIIDPGVPSGHVHLIAGGNGFGFNMDYAQTQQSSCTSCQITKDLSNYWVPSLYYAAENGSFISVESSGGPTVYYEQRGGPNNDPLLAFPEDFRMVAGDPFARSFTGNETAQAISYVCLDYSGGGPPQSNNFPTVNCPDGLRAQVYFPSCWNGSLDSADHKSHMAYPIGAVDSGSCPPSHPKHLISIFYEVIWNVDAFKDEWYGSGQPFVWSTGDPTGYGYHGDFVNGWDVPTLQQAVNQCTSDSGNLEDCPVFTLTSDNAATGCIIPPSINEQVSGVLTALPGCNPIQSGPGEAVSKSGCGAPTTVGQAETFFTDLTVTKGWEYLGCGTDSISDRILTGTSSSSDSMTVETCVDTCSSAGYSIAGLEYSSQCYCGNSLPSSGAPTPGVYGNCMMKCSGDSGEYCGGAPFISLYQKCGGTCQNVSYGLGSNSTSTPSKRSINKHRHNRFNHAS
ncbi:MAG: hypothetical protein M1827_004153 [Pycnora praestabilis]|nr:MAG: hypothetical protein M1827_004153 [Pycnora praestabilis]